MQHFLPDLPYNLVILIGFAATGLLFASGIDAHWLFGRFKKHNPVATSDAQNRGEKTYPRNRLTARIILGVGSALIICASLVWLSNYDYY